MPQKTSVNSKCSNYYKCSSKGRHNMMATLKALAILALAVAVTAQYNYDKPTTPRGTYLPPRETNEQIGPQGQTPDAEHEPGMPFDFTYAVKDDLGNDFSHQAESDGEVVQGEYRTLLPDGRLQIVKYTADWKNGYNAEITYEGEPSYPEPPRDGYQENDSQFVTPPKAPQPTQPPRTRPPPPPTRRPPPKITRPPPPPSRRPPPPPSRRPPPPPSRRPSPPPSRRPPPPPTRRPPPPPVTRPPPPPPPRTTKPPPGGLYGAPSLPFGVRNNPKFGYRK